MIVFDYHLEFALYRNMVVVTMMQRLIKFQKGCVEKSLVNLKFPLQGVSVTKCFDKHL